MCAVGTRGGMHNEGVNLHSSAYPTSRFRSLVVDAQTATSATPWCKPPSARA